MATGEQPAATAADVLDATRELAPTIAARAAEIETARRLPPDLARADASVAWTVMIGAATWIDMAGLPRATFDALFATPDVITAGVFNPTGSIAVTRGGYQVSGRWSFASGCEHADWLFGNCIEGVVDGVPRLLGRAGRSRRPRAR